MIAGTIRNAVNQMQLVNEWEQKKATGDVVDVYKRQGLNHAKQQFVQEGVVSVGTSVL